MFVGHGAIAFAIVAFAALSMGVHRRKAMALAVLAGLFATVPDVDMVYAITGLATLPTGGALGVAESFWSASSVVHRSMTHSLVISIPATAAFTLAGRSHLESLGAGIVGAAIVAIAWIVSGPITALVAGAFVLAGGAVGIGAAWYGIGRIPVAIMALVGLGTHPFGDVLTGQPPALFYPLPVTVFDGRIALSADPTLHLLGAFAFELTAIWLGVYAFARLRETTLQSTLRPRAALGAAYATAILVVPPPTLDGSYAFVFSVLAVGMVGAVPVRRRLPEALTAVTTGLAGVTVAGLAYLVAYLVLDAAPLVAGFGPPF